MNEKDILFFDYDVNFSEFYSEVFTKLSTDRYGVGIIKGFPNSNAEIIRLAKSIGYITAGRQTIVEPHNAEEYIAEVRYKSDVVVDKDGMNVFSETNSSIDLHTDSSYLVEIPPPDYILLYVEKQSIIGGDSVLINLDELLSKLDPELVQSLKLSIFPFRLGLAPILFNINGQPCIRYNYDLLRKSISDNVFAVETHVEAIVNRFQEYLNTFDQALTYKLADNDMLIANNHKNLHGRGAFDRSDLRILKRLRITSRELFALS